MTPSIRPRNNKRRWLVAVALLLTVMVIYFVFGGRGDEVERTYFVHRDDLVQRVTIGGTVTPIRRTIVTAPYDGYVKEIYVKTGQKVKKGDPIVTVVQSLASPEQVFPIRAAYDGTVVQILRSEGEFVRVADVKDFIVRIDDLSQMRVLAKAPEIDVVKIRLGQEVLIKATPILDRAYKGVLTTISKASLEKDPWANSQQIEYPITANITDADDRLLSGMSVLIDVISAKRENVLVIPHEFVMEKDGKMTVTLANGETREIKVGLRNEEAMEVISGLNEGEEVRQINFYDLVKKES